MRITFMGTPDFSVEILNSLLEHGHTVPLVITKPDKPTGRGRELSESAVKKYSLSKGITVFQPENLKGNDCLDTIKESESELIVVAAFGQILPEAVLSLPPLGCINVHASLLPKYRGASPIQQAILDGEKTSGVTIMQMDKGLDTGDILLQRSIDLSPKETAGSLFEKLSRLGGEALAEALALLSEGSLKSIPQENEKATVTSIIKKDAGHIDFSNTALYIERQIRAFDPWPVAYASLNGKKIKIWSADVQNDDTDSSSFETGAVAAIASDSFLIKCGEGLLRVKELQAEGKKRMAVKNFLNGYKLEKGAGFT